MEIDNEEVNHTRVLLENSDGFDGGSDWRYVSCTLSQTVLIVLQI